MWSNKYIGLEYKWGTNDCLRIVENVYKNEKDFIIKKGDEPVSEEWYIQNPNRIIKYAVENGAIIRDIDQLREFDCVFFKMRGIIRHLGVMTDNYGHFLHQLQKQTSRIDNIRSRHWSNCFYAGVRPNFTK